MIPSAGDIYWVEFDPALGTEQKGRRPALVISNERLNLRSPRLIVCAITSNARPWPTHVALPPTLRCTGFVMTDQVRTIDRGYRLSTFIERAPSEFLQIVIARLGLIIGLQLPPGP